MRLLKLRDSYKNAPSITWESTESDEMEEWRERSYGLNFYKIGFYEKHTKTHYRGAVGLLEGWSGAFWCFIETVQKTKGFTKERWGKWLGGLDLDVPKNEATNHSPQSKFAFLWYIR